MPLSFIDLFLSVLSKVEIWESTEGQYARARMRSMTDLQSASAKIILGLFPPSSRVTLFKLLLPAASWISFPTWKKGNGDRFYTPHSWDDQWPKPALGNSGMQPIGWHRNSSGGQPVWARYDIASVTRNAVSSFRVCLSLKELSWQRQSPPRGVPHLLTDGGRDIKATPFQPTTGQFWKTTCVPLGHIWLVWGCQACTAIRLPVSIPLRQGSLINNLHAKLHLRTSSAEPDQ